MQVNLEQIVQSEKPIRTTWSEEEMQQLVNSIKQWGVIQAVKLRPLDDDPFTEHDKRIYEIVDGARRVEAARRAGLETIEATIEGMDDQTALIQSLIANVQREDMSDLDKSNGLQSIQKLTGWSGGEMARRQIMGESDILRLLRIQKDPPAIQEKLRHQSDQTDERTLTARHADEVRTVLDNDSDKIAVLEKAQYEGIGHKTTRKIAEAVKAADDLGDERAKEALIAEPYSPLMHDPEIVKERHERFAKTNIPDPMYIRTDKERKSFAKKQQDEWERLPEAQTLLNYINKWHDVNLPSFERAAIIGKLSPEGRLFLARRVRRLATRLIKFAEQLEKE